MVLGLVIRSVEQIPALPWAGNFADDRRLSGMVDDFILSTKDREAQKEAIRLVNLHMCGEAVEVDDEALDVCLANMGRL